MDLLVSGCPSGRQGAIDSMINDAQSPDSRPQLDNSIAVSDAGTDTAGQDQARPDQRGLDQTPPDQALFDMLLSDKSAIDQSVLDQIIPDQVLLDLQLLDLQVPDQVLPDQLVLDQKLSDMKTHDQSIPDQIVVDQKLPDQQVPDMHPIDQSVPDKAMPDQMALDQMLPDLLVHDQFVPDQIIADQRLPDYQVPDIQIPDQSTPDHAVSDIAVPDKAIIDHGATDLAMPDSTVPDLAMVDSAVPDLGVLVSGKWISIKAGTYKMGSPNSEQCRNYTETQVQVTLTNGFDILATEVTQEQFQNVMGYNPAAFGPNGYPGPKGRCSNKMCPVENLSWHEAVAFCNSLSVKYGLANCYSCSGSGANVTCKTTAAATGKGIYSCKGFRLPTGAEWEYAYRAGTSTALYNGPVSSCSGYDANADQIAWYSQNFGNRTNPTAKKKPNPWGIYDMAGNVWEWCHDRMQAPLGPSPVTNPIGSLSTSRLIKGGSGGNGPALLRAAFRTLWTPSGRNQFIGFRCARTN